MLHKFKKLLPREVQKWVEVHFDVTLNMMLETMGCRQSVSLRDMVRSTRLHLVLLGGPSDKTRHFAHRITLQTVLIIAVILGLRDEML